MQPGTGRRGDLYLNLSVQDHPVWRIDGDQLRAELPVSMDELALGGTARDDSDGEAKVSVPAGTPGAACASRAKDGPTATVEAISC